MPRRLVTTWTAWGLAGLCSVSCGPGDTAIALRVSEIPLTASELRVQAEVDGQLSDAIGSYAPPPASQSELRLGVRLLGRQTGQARLEVSACNGACLLSKSSVTVDLAQGNAEPTVALQSQPERLDLLRCAARAPILCNVQLEVDDSTGDARFALEGSGFASDSRVQVGGTKVSTSRVLSPTRIEFTQPPTQSENAQLWEVALPDGSSVLRRLNIAGLPLRPEPTTVSAAALAPQISRVPIVTNLHVADLDLDGHVDVAVAGNYYTNTQGAVPDNPGFLVVYWGDGQRRFSRSELANFPGIPRSLTSGPLKGSGLPTLIVSTGEVLNFFGVNYATEYQPTGSVVFFDPSAPRTYAAPIEVKLSPRFYFVSPHQTAVMDVDRDGLNDLVVATSSARTTPLSTAGGLLWWKGSGPSTVLASLDPAMLNPILYDANLAPLAFIPWSGSVGDRPGDLAVTLSHKVTTTDYQGELWLLANNGSGTFTPQAQLPLTGLPLQIMAGDLTGDSRLDLLVTMPVANDRKTALRRLGLVASPESGAGLATVDLPLSLGLATTIDLFGDRRQDVALYNAGSAGGQLSLLFSRRVAPVLAQPTYSLRAATQGQSLLASADLDHDGKADLVAVTTGTLDAVSPFTSQFDVFYGQ